MADDPHAAVFLSYASQDAAAARRICEALRATGVEVWFDQNELVGGDSWDQKIRGQVKTCALFVPIISANTQARLEGYFRLEWKLAAQRTHTMADAKPFLLPVVIDATGDAEAHVPEEFRAVQWTRLPAGETPEKFCARVKSLLSGTVAGVADPGRSANAAPASARPATTKPFRGWLTLALIGAAAIIAFVVWQPWKIPASASLSEAQQLVAKARKILDEGDELNRETYTLAEEVLKKAEGLDVTEASAWALHVKVSTNFYNLGWDVTSTRREAILMQAGRAAKLAPGTLDAELAGAAARVALDQNRPEVQEHLRQLARAHPTDVQVLRQLVRAYGLDGKSQEATETVLQALKIAPDDPALKADLVNYLRVNNRFAEADAAVVSGMKGRVNARLLSFDAWFRLYWRGDTAGVVAAIAKWPAWFLAEDRGAAMAAFAHLWQGDSARAIQVLQALPGDEVRDSLFAGPRAAFIALAHEQAGQADSAVANWRIALQVAQRRLASAPDDIVALHWQAWAQARLGDTPAATRGFRLLRERSPLPSSLYLFGGLAGLALAAGQRDEALAALAPTPYSGVPTAREPTKAILRINRVFDPLRNDPRFQALVAAAPGPEEKKENQPTSTSPAAPAPNEKSLVVLPLENLSPDPENAFFTEGMHAEITTTLSRVPDLKVISRDSAVALKDSKVSLAEKAEKVGVANVLTGSVRRDGTSVRVSLELRRARDEALLWSQTYTKGLGAGVLSIQTDIAEQVARVLQARSPKGTLAGARFMTNNAEAYDRLMKFSRAYDRDPSLAGSAAAFTELEEIVRLDPDFMQAVSFLSTNHSRAYANATDSAARARHASEAKRLGEIASRLVPGGAGDDALANYYYRVERNYGRALEFAQNFIRALPNEASAHNRAGLVLNALGQGREAIVETKRALELDPLHPIYWSNLVGLLSRHRRRPEAEAALDRLLSLSPEANTWPAILGARFALTGALPDDLDHVDADWLLRARRYRDSLTRTEQALSGSELGDLRRLQLLNRQSGALQLLHRSDEAVAVARTQLALAARLQPIDTSDLIQVARCRAWALVRVSQEEEGVTVGKRLVESLSPTERYRQRLEAETYLAEIYAYLKRPRDCCELIAKLLRVPSGLTVPMLKVDPTWDNVRDDPAFQALLADPKNSAPL